MVQVRGDGQMSTVCGLSLRLGSEDRPLQYFASQSALHCCVCIVILRLQATQSTRNRICWTGYPVSGTRVSPWSGDLAGQASIGGFWHPADVKKSTRRGSPRRRQQCKLHNDFDSTIRYPAPHYSYWRIKTAQYTPYRYDELQVAALSSANPQPTRSNTPLEFLQPHHSSTLSENLDVLPT